jgi:hypothetical protein
LFCKLEVNHTVRKQFDIFGWYISADFVYHQILIIDLVQTFDLPVTSSSTFYLRVCICNFSRKNPRESGSGQHLIICKSPGFMKSFFTGIYRNINMN